ncbi:MAG: hypothetical protein E7211_20440 [Clostridium lundense]|nr:hypothetical protein [Clostridium lundense]
MRRMDIRDLDKLAKNGGEMPPCLAAYEQAYYQASRYLYQQFFYDKLNLLECRQEKQKIVEAYNLGKGQWEFFVGLTIIEDKLKRLKEQGFNSVLEWEILDDVTRLLDNK